MIYFYCQSYQAFNMALTFSLQKKIVIITSVENIIKACDFLKLEYLVHKKFNLNDFIFKRKQVLSEINRLVKIIAVDELHFSHTQFAIFNFLLVKELNNAGKRTVFHNFEFVYNKPTYMAWFNIVYFRLRLYLLIYRLLYGDFLTVRMSTLSSFMVSLKLEFISRTCYKVIDNKANYYDLTLSMFKEIRFDYPEIENLFIAQTFSNSLFDKQNKINDLIPILNSAAIAVKAHPKLGNIYGLDKGPELPAFLPVELFFSKVSNCIISIHSASLITASKFDNAKVISLLELAKVKDSFFDRVRCDLEVKSNGRIMFPSTIEQFKLLLRK